MAAMREVDVCRCPDTCQNIKINMSKTVSVGAMPGRFWSELSEVMDLSMATWPVSKSLGNQRELEVIPQQPISD